MYGLVKHKKSRMSERYYTREHKGLNQLRRSLKKVNACAVR